MLTALLGGGERRADPLRDPDWPGWSNMDGGLKSDSGITVTRDRALMLPAVWQAVAMISGDVAKLPLDLYRKSGADEADREIQKMHPAQWLVRRQANDMPMSAFQFWRQMMGDALIWNNAYARIIYDGAMRPVELLPLLPDRTDVEIGPDGRYIYVTEVGRRLVALDPLDVMHVRGVMLTTSDSGEAPSLLHVAREAIGLGLAAQKFQSRFFKNGMRASGILQLPASMPKDARDRLEQGFRKQHEGDDNWFKTVVLREGAQFQSISQTNEQGQSHELREDQVREVARLFNLPPSRLGLSDSVAYNSKAEDNRAYHDTTLAPWLQTIADECWLKLLPQRARFSGELYFEHNTASLLRLDLNLRYTAYQTGINAGFLLKSEVRKFENLPAIEGIDEPPEPPPMLLQEQDDDEADEADDQQPEGPNAERDAWIREAKGRLSWRQLGEELRRVAPDRGWPLVGYERLRQIVRAAKLPAIPN